MKLLVAVDGSDQSERALAYAIDVIGPGTGSASLTVVHAVDPQVYSEGGVEPVADLSDAAGRLVIESVEAAERRGLDLLDDARAVAGDRGVEVATELLYGDPVEQVPELVDADGYDGVFVGHRGLSDKYERVLGSVAKGILERVTVPVTVVR